jgi:hypothetical protein
VPSKHRTCQFWVMFILWFCVALLPSSSPLHFQQELPTQTHAATFHRAAHTPHSPPHARLLLLPPPPPPRPSSPSSSLLRAGQGQKRGRNRKGDFHQMIGCVCAGCGEWERRLRAILTYDCDARDVVINYTAGQLQHSILLPFLLRAGIRVLQVLGQ